MPIRAKLDVSKLIKKLESVPEKMQAPLTRLVTREAKYWLQDVIKYTPPASKRAQSAAARSQGEAAVARDINKVYGTGPSVYASLKEYDEGAAKGFYKAMLQGDFKAASKILQTSNSPLKSVPIETFNPALHQQVRKRGKVDVRQPLQIPRSWRRIESYTKKRQKKVGFLMSGYGPAASSLRAKLPPWAKRHKGPGAFKAGRLTTSYKVRVTNSVSYATHKGAQQRQDFFARGAKSEIRKKLKGALRRTLRNAGF